MIVTATAHVPVLLDRVVDLLRDAPPGAILDATVGAGGHAAAVLAARGDRHGSAELVGIDRDPAALELAERRLENGPGEVTLVRAGFGDLGPVLEDLGISTLAGFLFDLGVSSMQLDRQERGFSYRLEGPLDMRMDPDQPVRAADIVNEAPEEELARILATYGEERSARRIAAAIVRARPLQTTRDLAEVVRSAIPAAARRTGGHPATRTFQALRIAVNAELESLERVLPVALERLAPGGVGVAISYHSLEDRLVKRAFVAAARLCTCPPGLPVCVCGADPAVELVTRRPERPSSDEVEANPRARSARLRAVRRRRGDVSSAGGRRT